MHDGYHLIWQNNRINFILNLFGKDFFKNKKVLELAPFNGYVGYQFSQLGAQVHGVEGRLENVEYIKTHYPNIKIEQGDLDCLDWKWGKWDIIINFGLYYHLEKYHYEHLVNCIKNCDLMFFETVVFDSNEDELFFRDEAGIDQSLTNKGGNPSTLYIENILSRQNVEFKKYCSAELNGNSHHYDWSDLNSKQLDPWARRFWVINALVEHQGKIN